MKVISLEGCTPEPLGNYLKALGVFRLISEQADPPARAWWNDGRFIVLSNFEKPDDLLQWFREKYQPSPLLAPWSVNSGWWPPKTDPPGKGDKRGTPNRCLRQLCNNTDTRFDRIRRSVASYLASFDAGTELPDCESALSQSLRELLDDIENQIRKSQTRARLIRLLRNQLDDVAAVRWLDAIGAIGRRSEDTAFLFPMLGDAGAEGVNSFIGNFYGRLCDHLPVTVPAAEFWASDQGGLSASRLASALFGEPSPGSREADAAGGFYWPSLVEAPNIGQAFISKPKKRANPWEFILAMEGTLLWSSAMTRRAEVIPGDRVSFPFYCDGSLGGAVSLGPNESPGGPDTKTNGEIWCPLWDRPASLSEIERLFVEGRLTIFEKTATRAVQFATAVASFGLERGIRSFTRVGLLERSGSGDQTTTLAVRLGQWRPRRLRDTELLRELDQFHEKVAELIQHHANQPRRIVLARTHFEQAIFDFAGEPLGAGTAEHCQRLLSVIVAAASLERELAVTAGRVKYRGRQDLETRTVAPIQPLPHAWLLRRNKTGWTCPVDDGTVEFRLARAIGSICPWGELERDGRVIPVVESLRTNLLPLARFGSSWTWDAPSRCAVWVRGTTLLDNLARVLQRRLIDASRGKGNGLPLWSPNGARFSDLLALWNNQVDEERLTELIHALALVNTGRPSDDQIAPRQAAVDPTPDLSPTGVWFDPSGEPHANFPPLTWNDRPLLSPANLEAAFLLPRAYPILKMCFLGGQLPARPLEGRTVPRTGSEPYPPFDSAILNLLLAGRDDEAVQRAGQKLHAKGYPPIVTRSALLSREFTMPASDCQRLGGLLLVPVQNAGVVAALAIKPISK